MMMTTTTMMMMIKTGDGDDDDDNDDDDDGSYGNDGSCSSSSHRHRTISSKRSYKQNLTSSCKIQEKKDDPQVTLLTGVTVCAEKGRTSLGQKPCDLQTPRGKNVPSTCSCQVKLVTATVVIHCHQKTFAPCRGFPLASGITSRKSSANVIKETRATYCCR